MEKIVITTCVTKVSRLYLPKEKLTMHEMLIFFNIAFLAFNTSYINIKKSLRFSCFLKKT